MSRILRTITAVVLVGIITFCAIAVCQNIGQALRIDMTQEKLYNLSGGTKSVLKKLNQPLTLKLYYTKTATRKARDEIRYYNHYYNFVKDLLAEYARSSKGMVKVQIIDPRPYSEQEESALRYGLRRLPITTEENFFFGLVLQTEFGVVKTIPFFSPQRQNFVEYDISHLIDMAITREKKRIGILSSLPVMGQDESGYMAALRQMQGLPSRPPWTIVQQLKQGYDVTRIETDVEKIEDIDILLVIHPKNLPDKTLFAIEQFVLKGGRAIICVDPHCFVDNTTGQMGRQQGQPSSNLNKLLRRWGVEMPEGQFAGDRSMALSAQMEQNRRMQKLIGYLLVSDKCFNRDNVVTANLNEVRILFAGVLNKTSPSEDKESGKQNKIIPLLQTTNRGNSWSASSPLDWVRINPEKFMGYFEDGTEPVVMGCLIKGVFESAFPDGVEVTVKSSEDKTTEKSDNPDKQDKEEPTTKKLTGLTRAEQECAVMVFSDVDFLSDMMAFRDTIFGMKVAVGNNSDLLFNALDDFSGSSDLIGIRSRGNFERPFVVVNKIRQEAQKKWASKVTSMQAEIERIKKELDQVQASAGQGQEKLLRDSIVDKQRQLHLKLRQAQGDLLEVKKKRYESIEQLGTMLQNLNMWSAPAVILAIAILLSIRQSILRRRHVSHLSDAG